ncbi:hypothetical protein L226DRAFT_526419 [Lentinus tigrinus ALCF2SS1-7]|uniref:F-box domain-containing protein n=1 Tax=Lentinus tigrinus ALCF2SS1-6 TaxID=1328759 RepID=A0A5C2RWV4_9APHY|nr:hypothetical protein L227DRAFT_566911 [Lentinus tigrinus ALCF2SS1-6]RPD69719.1 hypothetical protein L226DRAFT_526419 [Lentinus tigrinus ALCF2SS1-7]
MAQLLRSVFAFTSAPGNARRRGHRAVAKKVGAARMSRHNSEGKVQWEMLSVPPTLLVLDAGDDEPMTPAWFGEDNAAESSPRSPPVAPVCSDLKLPFELWEFVYSHLEDGYDIHSLARVCKGLRKVAHEAIKRHARFVEAHRAVELTSYESMLDFLALMQYSPPRLSLAIRDLTIHHKIRWNTTSNSSLPTVLIQILKSLPNLRSLSLHISSAELVLVCLRAGLASVVHPHLRVFSTSLAYTPDILRFIQRHPTIEDLSIPDYDLGVNALDRESVLPSLRILSCGLPTLLRFGRASTLTHLHLQVHVPQTLETVASLLGAQLISLRLGVLERLPDLHSPRIVWSPQDILTRFPRLAYIQIHMFEPDLLPHPIQWQQKRDRSFKLSRRTPLTVAWVLEEDAWGTLLDPRDTDIVRQLFDEVAFDVLRYWTPQITRVVYGDSGTPDMSVTLSSSGNCVVRSEDPSLGEDYWKRVQALGLHGNPLLVHLHYVSCIPAMTAMLARPLSTRYDSVMRPHTPLHDRTVTNAPLEHAYNRNHATPEYYGKKGGASTHTKISALEYGHLPTTTSRLANVPSRRRRRGASRENYVPTAQQEASASVATRLRVAADFGRSKMNTFEEDVNPFIDPDNEWDVSPEPSHANTASSPEPACDNLLDHHADSTQQDEETFVYIPQSATTSSSHPPDRPERIPGGEKRSPARARRQSWKAPGPSPLSQTISHVHSNRASARELPLMDAMLDNVASGYHPLSIRPLPRTFAGKHRGRVAISLHYNFLLRNFLRRIYFLDIESPELDFVDGESIEFLLDLQVDLLEGFVTIPSLSSYAIADRPALGSPRRRFLWRSGQTFPRRLEDYERAAAKLLSRKRISPTHQQGI